MYWLLLAGDKKSSGLFSSQTSNDIQFEITCGRSFRFGTNWEIYLSTVTEGRIRIAENSLRTILSAKDLSGRTFLDMGCGSGMFSLAARSWAQPSTPSTTIRSRWRARSIFALYTSPMMRIGPSGSAPYSTGLFMTGWIDPIAFTHGASCITLESCGRQSITHRHWSRAEGFCSQPCTTIRE